MNIITNYTNVLKKYIKFDGRATRSEYWYFFLANFLISFVISFVIGFAAGENDSGTDLTVISNVYSLATLLPSIAVLIRRMHDVGKSGWFGLIPIYNLILACTDSEKTANKYGPNPKQIPNT